MRLETIETENIIFSYLKNNRKEKKVELSTLMHYVKALERKFEEKQTGEKKNDFVYINYTRDSLMNAIMRHWDLLKLQKDTIEVKSPYDAESASIAESKLPYSIKTDYLSLFDTVDKEIKGQQQIHSEYA